VRVRVSMHERVCGHGDVCVRVCVCFLVCVDGWLGLWVCAWVSGFVVVNLHAHCATPCILAVRIPCARAVAIAQRSTPAFTHHHHLSHSQCAQSCAAGGRMALIPPGTSPHVVAALLKRFLLGEYIARGWPLDKRAGWRPCQASSTLMHLRCVGLCPDPTLSLRFDSLPTTLIFRPPGAPAHLQAAARLDHCRRRPRVSSGLCADCVLVSLPGRTHLWFVPSCLLLNTQPAHASAGRPPHLPRNPTMAGRYCNPPPQPSRVCGRTPAARQRQRAAPPAGGVPPRRRQRRRHRDGRTGGCSTAAGGCPGPLRALEQQRGGMRHPMTRSITAWPQPLTLF
jgi:hypothetical protein